MTNFDNLQILKQQLDAQKEAILGMIPAHLVDPLKKSVDTTINSFTPSKTLSVGDVVPDFELSNSMNKTVKLSDILADHKSVVLTWYRGGWCPYCNLTLRAFVKNTELFEQFGAKFVAITPELPDESLSTSEKLGLKFEVLSDVGLKVGDQFGVSFTVKEDIIETYDTLGFHLKNMYGHNGDKNAVVRLPVPATFVIDKNMKIVYRFVDSDYTKRAEPADVIQAVKSIDV